MKIKLTFKNGTVEEYDEITSVTWGGGKLTLDLGGARLIIRTRFLYGWVIV